MTVDVAPVGASRFAADLAVGVVFVGLAGNGVEDAVVLHAIEKRIRRVASITGIIQVNFKAGLPIFVPFRRLLPYQPKRRYPV